MKQETIIKKFREVLKKDGRNLIWFNRNYLPKIRYNYMMYQINGFKQTGIDEDIITAIEKYLEDK